MNATCLLISGLMAGADTPPPPVAAVGPIVVSTGAGCVGCGSAAAVHAPAPAVLVHSVANSPCNPCGGQHATLVDWMRAKAAEPTKPGLIARLRAKHAKPATAAGHTVASPCDPCGGVHAAPVVIGNPAPAMALPGTVITSPGTVITSPGTVITSPGTVITTPSTIVPGTTTTPAIPKEMPKVKDMPKVVDPPKDLPKDPPKVSGSDAPPPKVIEVPKIGGGADAPKVIEVPKVNPPKSDPPKGPGSISIPPLPLIPASGTNSPY